MDNSHWQKEVEFEKYEKRGAGYHWEQNSLHPLKMNAFAKARYKKCLDLIESKIGDFSGKKILDFGCGDGVLTFELFRRGAEAYGIDISETAISFAKRKHGSLGSNASFFVESCCKTHFTNEFFDAIVSSDVIEHVAEVDMFLKEAHRILKTGGIAVISTPLRIFEFPLDKSHVVEWFPDEFKKIVKSVFPKMGIYYSHPVFWFELINYNRLTGLLVNLISYCKNPFLGTSGWRTFCMQYAVCEKA
jgi:2-polyprenyl-3-methyl-5-hydroxy-6-metoxy-1,4-benzoquinol methylase